MLGSLCERWKRNVYACILNYNAIKTSSNDSMQMLFIFYKILRISLESTLRFCIVFFPTIPQAFLLNLCSFLAIKHDNFGVIGVPWEIHPDAIEHTLTGSILWQLFHGGTSLTGSILWQLVSGCRYIHVIQEKCCCHLLFASYPIEFWLQNLVNYKCVLLYLVLFDRLQHSFCMLIFGCWVLKNFLPQVL